MAKCQMCGTEVKIGQRCKYCGSMAEPHFYPISTRIIDKIFPVSHKRNGIKDQQKKSRDGDVTGRIHIVKDGDNLWKISKQYYGKGSEYKRIVEANPEITNPQIIYPGQIIKIPF